MTDERPTLKLIGTDGNAFAVLAKARAALKAEGYSKAEIERYTEEATAGDYDHLLRVTMEWFDVE